MCLEEAAKLEWISISLFVRFIAFSTLFFCFCERGVKCIRLIRFTAGNGIVTDAIVTLTAAKTQCNLGNKNWNN